MLIASKFEEIYAPEVNDFVYITDNAYTFQNILDMEVGTQKSYTESVHFTQNQGPVDIKNFLRYRH